MTRSRCSRARTAASAGRSCAPSRREGTVVVDGANMAKRHTKARGADDAGRHHRQGHAACRSPLLRSCARRAEDRAGSECVRTRRAKAPLLQAMRVGPVSDPETGAAPAEEQAAKSAPAKSSAAQKRAGGSESKRTEPPVGRKSRQCREIRQAGRWSGTASAPQGAIRHRGSRRARRDAWAFERDGSARGSRRSW